MCTEIQHDSFTAWDFIFFYSRTVFPLLWHVIAVHRKKQSPRAVQRSLEPMQREGTAYPCVCLQKAWSWGHSGTGRQQWLWSVSPSSLQLLGMIFNMYRYQSPTSDTPEVRWPQLRSVNHVFSPRSCCCLDCWVVRKQRNVSSANMCPCNSSRPGGHITFNKNLAMDQVSSSNNAPASAGRDCYLHHQCLDPERPMEQGVTMRASSWSPFSWAAVSNRILWSFK